MSGTTYKVRHLTGAVLNTFRLLLRMFPKQEMLYIPEQMGSLNRLRQNSKNGETLGLYSYITDELSKWQGKSKKKRLKNSRTGFIMFVDDLDRLMDDEVTDILCAVKAVGNLLYVKYVLLYDRDSVTKALDEKPPRKG